MVVERSLLNYVVSDANNRSSVGVRIKIINPVERGAKGLIEFRTYYGKNLIIVTKNDCCFIVSLGWWELNVFFWIVLSQ